VHDEPAWVARFEEGLSRLRHEVRNYAQIVIAVQVRVEALSIINDDVTKLQEEVSRLRERVARNDVAVEDVNRIKVAVAGSILTGLVALGVALLTGR